MSSKRSRMLIASITFFICLIAVYLYIGRKPHPATATLVDNSDPISVVLVLVDQLRADRLGIYGSSGGYTPVLDGYARDGFYFSNARASAPWTYPSVVSLHTGLYPTKHGANRLPEWGISPVPSRITTLAEFLNHHGYMTAGFITNPYLKPESHFAQGFVHYEHEFVKSWGVNRKNSQDRWWQASMYADTVNSRIFSYLKTAPHKAHFLYIHYIDVHGPWDAAPFCVPGEACAKNDKEIYQRSIRFVDRHIGQLYESVKRAFNGRFLFIVTADHGRTLEDSDSTSLFKVSKASLHEFNLRVPLIFFPTKVFKFKGVSHEPVSLVDIFPTLLDMLAPGFSYKGELDGISIAPLFKGQHLARRTLFAENDDTTTHYKARASILDNTKFMEVVAPAPGYFEFALDKDPFELAPPLIKLSPRQKVALQLLYKAYSEMEKKKMTADKHSPLDSDTIKQLKALGYLQ